MSFSIKKLSLLLTVLLISLSSCRDAEIIDVDGSGDQALKANSEVATLMQRTSKNDGSNDNILDNANCFNLKFPVTVIANGQMITVTNEDDLDKVEDIFDALDDDTDEIMLNFPITIILSDFTEVIINNEDELDKYLDDCQGENEYDDDIECLDFVYPISGVVFNTDTELTTNITINNDMEMYFFIEDLDDDDVVSINFPISVILADGTTVNIASLSDLEIVIEGAEDDCDEDDDYDYNDDDCLACTPQLVENIFSTCNSWIVDKLEINDNVLEDLYVAFSFNFSNDGTITVQENANIFNGTWSTSGSGMNMVVVINIPLLPDFNASWNLHEIHSTATEDKVDLRLPNDNRLRFESTCK